MSPIVILALIMLAPVVLLMVFRINAVLVFLSLCLGNVLVQFVAPDTRSMITLFAANNSRLVNASNNSISIALLLLPAVLTILFMFHSVRGHSKLLLNVLPAIGVGLLMALLLVPLLSPGLRYAIVGTPLWQQVQRSQVLIVGTSSLICLLVLWLQRPKRHHEEKHSKHHKE